MRSCLAYLWQCRSNGKHCHVQSAFCNLKVPYMYNKTKTIYQQLKFLHTEAAIKRCSTNMIKTLEKYLQKNPFLVKLQVVDLQLYLEWILSQVLSNNFSWLLLFITLSKQKTEPWYKLSWKFQQYLRQKCSWNQK